MYSMSNSTSMGPDSSTSELTRLEVVVLFFLNIYVVVAVISPFTDKR